MRKESAGSTTQLLMAFTLVWGAKAGSLSAASPDMESMRTAIQAQIDFTQERAAIRRRDPDGKQLLRYPELAKAVSELRTKLERLEQTNSTLIADRQVKEARVIAFRIDQPTPEQAALLHAELAALPEHFASGSEGSALASQQADALLKEFLFYPNPYKFVITTDSYTSGRLRLEEWFLGFKNRELVRDDGGTVRYGNDYPSGGQRYSLRRRFMGEASLQPPFLIRAV
jgi:hypothetical protein